MISFVCVNQILNNQNLPAIVIRTQEVFQHLRKYSIDNPMIMSVSRNKSGINKRLKIKDSPIEQSSQTPKILTLSPTVFEPIASKYIVLRERNTNYVGGKLSKSYLTDVKNVYEFLIDDIGILADDNVKILAIVLQQLIHQEIRSAGILDLRLNTAAKLQQGIQETMQAIELFEKNALNVEGIKFIVRRKSFEKGQLISSPKDFERTGDPIGLKTARGLEIVNLVMQSLLAKKSEFEEILRLQRENEKLRKKHPSKESVARTKTAIRLAKKIDSFLVAEMNMNRATSIHTTAQILDAFGFMPNARKSSDAKQKKKMYDLCRKYLKS
jgi:hypothetical protein